MKLTLEGNVEEIGDQVAALDKLFQAECEAAPIAPPVSSPAPPVITPPPDPCPTRVPDSNVVELDPDGQPWNGEIHSSNHSRKKDGRWTLRRGVDRNRVAAVYAEYTARAPLAATELSQPPLGVVPAPVQPPPVTLSPPPPPFTLPAGAPPPLTLPPPAPVAEDPLTACIRVAAAIMALTNDPGQKAVIGARINGVMTQNGLPGGNMATLEANPQFAPTVLAGLNALATELGVPC